MSESVGQAARLSGNRPANDAVQPDKRAACPTTYSETIVKLRWLEAELWLPVEIEKVFDFFSDARNLDTLTPPWLHFQILTPSPIVMSAGTLIDYRLRLHGIPIRWQSEITVWNPPHEFVDEQRRGPYKRWVHRHEFASHEGGTLIRDQIEYAVRGWICEPLVHRWFVVRDLRSIFLFRQQKMCELLAPQGGTREAKMTLR